MRRARHFLKYKMKGMPVKEPNVPSASAEHIPDRKSELEVANNLKAAYLGLRWTSLKSFM